MPQRFELRRGLSFCEVGGTHVFLDIVEDRYFCLGSEAEAHFCAMLREPGRSVLERSEFLQTGLIVECDHDCPVQPVAAPAAARASVLDTQMQGSGMAAAMLSLSRLARVRLQLRFRGLAATLAALRSVKAHQATRPGTLAQLQEVVAPFSRAAKIATTRDLCLSHSIAIARSLIRSGLDADLVMGVRHGPFAAHCWVQHGEYVVNDRVDTIRIFTPILVL